MRPRLVMCGIATVSSSALDSTACTNPTGTPTTRAGRGGALPDHVYDLKQGGGRVSHHDHPAFHLGGAPAHRDAGAGGVPLPGQCGPSAPRISGITARLPKSARLRLLSRPGMPFTSVMMWQPPGQRLHAGSYGVRGERPPCWPRCSQSRRWSGLCAGPAATRRPYSRGVPTSRSMMSMLASSMDCPTLVCTALNLAARSRIKSTMASSAPMWRVMQTCRSAEAAQRRLEVRVDVPLDVGALVQKVEHYRQGAGGRLPRMPVSPPLCPAALSPESNRSTFLYVRRSSSTR